jgi:spermidine synthase
MIRCFEEYFMPSLANHQLVCADANEYVFSADQAAYDSIIIDLFTGNSSPPFLMEPSFYQQLLRLLNEKGMIAINVLAHGQVHFDAILDVLIEVTETLPLCFSVPGFKNRILLLSREPLSPIGYSPELLAFASKHGIDLNVFMPINLKRYNYGKGR